MFCMLVIAFHSTSENLAKEEACEVGRSVSRQYNLWMFLWHIDMHTGKQPKAGTKSALPTLNIQGSQYESIFIDHSPDTFHD